MFSLFISDHNPLHCTDIFQNLTTGLHQIYFRDPETQTSKNQTFPPQDQRGAGAPDIRLYQATLSLQDWSIGFIALISNSGYMLNNACHYLLCTGSW